MKHANTNLSSRLLVRIAVSVTVAVMVGIVGALPALSQPERIGGDAISSYSRTSSIGVWDQGADEELCFEVLTRIDFFQLACTDGSAVKQVSNIGPGNTNIAEVASFQGDLYFSADDDAEGWELFRYNGTSVSRLTTLEPSSGIALPENFVVYDGALYFNANGSEGGEIYRYTGTVVERVTTIGGTRVDPDELLVHDGELYFVAKDPTVLYSFDGTSLSQKSDVRSDGNDPRIRDLASYNGALFFSADPGNGNGRQLIRYDGSTYEAVFVATPDGGDKSPDDLTTYDGYLFYSANTSSGRELFRYNEGAERTEAPLTFLDTPSSDPRNVTGYNGNIYFSARDATNGRELYSIPAGGFANSTRIDLRPGAEDSDPSDLTVHDGNLYFSATVSDADSGEDVLHRYDGSFYTAVRTINNFGGDGFGTFESDKVVYDGDLYFVLNNESLGEELFRSDGSTIELVEDISSGAESSSPDNLIQYDGDLYFQARTPSTGIELFHYDGSSVNVAADIVSGSGSSDPTGLTRYNGFLYFAARDANQDRELYRYSPSTGAQLVENINSSRSAFDVFSFLIDFQVYDGDLYFAATTDANGIELYRSSGLSATRVTDINSGSEDSFPGSLTVYDGILYFRADNGNGFELYGYNASSDVVQQVNTLNPNPSDDGVNRFTEMAVYDGSLYFMGDNGSTGYELFQYDGFSMSLVQDIASGSTSSTPVDFAVYNQRLYFTALTADRGREPYTFDGQTVRSNDFVDGPVSGGGTDPAVYDDGTGPRLFVSATDNVSGIELYAFTESDGPLPVELTQMNAAMGEQSATLTWATASETGNAGFEVQRQPVGGEAPWTDLGFVEGSGTTSQPQSYRFEDTDLPFEADAVRYRLRQVDQDGTAHLSDPITATRGSVGEVEMRGAYPNPTAARTQVELAVPEDAKEARLELFDLLGRKVKTVATGLEGGRQTQTFQVSRLSPGVYFLRLRAAGTVTTQKLTVVR